MTFEEKLRKRIATAPFQSAERQLLKVVLGECQRKTLKTPTDEMGQNIVRKMIKANEENITRLHPEDPRIEDFNEENRVLGSLLPKFLSAAEIRQRLEEDGVDIAGARNDGQAMGAAMKHLKGLNAPVEGDVVKSVVSQMRED
jgi:uncharacterized protein YqeY